MSSKTVILNICISRLGNSCTLLRYLLILFKDTQTTCVRNSILLRNSQVLFLTYLREKQLRKIEK